MQDSTPRPLSMRPPFVLLALFAATILPELWLTGAEMGLWGSPLQRFLSFLVGAFNPGFLTGTPPIWTGQPWGMFVTHVFLHVGFWHMASNMVTLYLLWYLMPWLSLRRFMTIYGIAALGGALAFMMMSPPGASMTGASGAISGLAAVWALSELFLIREGIVLVLRQKRMTALLVLISVGLMLNLTHSLNTAWQAHLGGALAGAFMAVLFWIQGSRPTL